MARCGLALQLGYTRELRGKSGHTNVAKSEFSLSRILQKYCIEEMTKRLSNLLKNDAKNFHLSARGFPKSTKMVAKNDLGSRSFRGTVPGRPSIYLFEHYWGHLADFGRFLVPLKIRGGAKNGPKKRILYIPCMVTNVKV